MADARALSSGLHALRRAQPPLGDDDWAHLKRHLRLFRLWELVGRLALHLGGPIGWLIGVMAMTLHYCLGAELMHSVMHGAYVGLPQAKRYTPARYESLAVPLRTRTWGDAHARHHRRPSVIGEDPDTAHPLYRVHDALHWRVWHRLQWLLAPLFTFESCAFTYDRFLKRVGQRPAGDRRELAKLLTFVLYQFVLFPLLAGANWWVVLTGNLTAHLLRNLVTGMLQMSNSTGHKVSTVHAHHGERPNAAAWVKFQVESSKNFIAHPVWRPFFGGLDRHIEHHLFPHLPPPRLEALAPKVRALCDANGVDYEEYPSLRASLADSLSHLRTLARRPRIAA